MVVGVAGSVAGGDPGALLDPFDVVVLLSFGGPERPEDVMPFLRRVTGGRGIPDERLASVAEHYHGFGGRSPINDRNRELIAALRRELDARGLSGVPVRWGNRNWSPFLVDALREAYDDGYRRPLVVTTSAYSSYSSCRQYREDLAQAFATLDGEGRHLEAGKVRQYYNHPGFAQAATDATVQALDRLSARLPAGADPAAVRLLFVTHSIPDAMDRGSGRRPGTYRAQHEDLMSVVADRVRRATGVDHRAELVFCSRSGAPGSPWLEPDVNDRLRELAGPASTPGNGPVAGVVAVPIGFVSDHMEVVFDLDTEARATAAELGVPFERAATVGTHPAFVTGLVDLCLERAAEARGEHPDRPVVGGLGPVCSRCADTCCTLGAIAQPAWQGSLLVPAPGAGAPAAGPGTRR